MILRRRIKGFNHIIPLHVIIQGNGGDPLATLVFYHYTTHRINVGGLTLTPENGTLWRNWVPDDDYLVSNDSAKNCDFYSDRPKYLSRGATTYSPPDLVYQTCKELSIDDSRASNLSNIAWRFGASKNARHLVRAHFCDIISISNNVLNFSFYVYSKYSQKIDSYDLTRQLASPFYIDFVVDSDASGFMNISIGPRQESLSHNAFLNGLEIMELMEESGWVPMQTELKKKVLFVIVGSVCGVAFVLILIVVFLLCLKRRKPKPVKTVGSPHLFLCGGGDSHSQITERNANVSPVPNLNLKLKMPFAEILDATHNFDTKLLIGEGGFGKVYKGTLQSGMEVAVKRSDPKHG